MNKQCPICKTESIHFLFVPFMHLKQFFGEEQNDEIDYYKCNNCGCVFSPVILYDWTSDDFRKRCYNETYKNYDMDVAIPNGNRTLAFFNLILINFTKETKHLDYGGGKGWLSLKLKNFGYNSFCYDPYTEFNDKNILNNEYDLITAVEVFEHSNNIHEIMGTIKKSLKKDGTLVVSTGLYTDKINFMNWYYMSPRVGHIQIFNKKCLEILLAQYSMKIVDVFPQHEEQKIIVVKNV